MGKKRTTDDEKGYFEEYRCGCVSDVARFKKDLPGYCPKHGDNRRHIHRLHPYLVAKRKDRHDR
jgi:hypothetical protein